MQATREEEIQARVELDERLGLTYPMMRSFKAVGSAEESYEKAVLDAISEFVGYQVPYLLVKRRASRQGTYWTVDVGPVEVKDAKQIVDIYARIKQDKRTKFMM